MLIAALVIVMQNPINTVAAVSNGTLTLKY